MSIYDSLSIQVNDNSSNEPNDNLSIGANDTLSRSLGNALSGMGHACCLTKANDNLSRSASVPWPFGFRTTPLMPRQLALERLRAGQGSAGAVDR
jgi:hypothetical protein